MIRHCWGQEKEQKLVYDPMDYPLHVIFTTCIVEVLFWGDWLLSNLDFLLKHLAGHQYLTSTQKG